MARTPERTVKVKTFNDVMVLAMRIEREFELGQRLIEESALAEAVKPLREETLDPTQPEVPMAARPGALHSAQQNFARLHEQTLWSLLNHRFRRLHNERQGACTAKALEASQPGSLHPAQPEALVPVQPEVRERARSEVLKLAHVGSLKPA